MWRGVCLFFIVLLSLLLFGRAAAKLLISLFFLIPHAVFCSVVVAWPRQNKVVASLPFCFFFSFFPPCPPSFLFPHLFLSLLFSFSLPLFFPFVWQHFDVRLNCSRGVFVFKLSTTCGQLRRAICTLRAINPQNIENFDKVINILLWKSWFLWKSVLQ